MSASADEGGSGSSVLEGDWGPRPKFTTCVGLQSSGTETATVSDDGYTIDVQGAGSRSVFLDPFGEYGCPQTINKNEDELDFDAPKGQFIDFEEPTPDYRIEVVGVSSSDYIQFGAGQFYWGTDITKKCGNRHEGSHWRYAHGAFSNNQAVETRGPGDIPPKSRVTAVLEYQAGEGRFTVTAEGKGECVVATHLPPGCIIFAGACGGTVTLLAGRSTLGTPKTKSARKG
jgi:hypothetical protein